MAFDPFGAKKKHKRLQKRNLGIILGQVNKGAEELLDLRTREEILNVTQNPAVSGASGITQPLMDAAQILKDAQEGTAPKYKARMKVQQMYNLMVDRPDSARLRGGILDFGSAVRK